MADLEQQFLTTDPEVLGLQRQRQLADLLTSQAFNQPQGQMISGRYVAPSALQQALPMIQAAIGGLTNANLDTKQQQLAEALRGKQMDIAKRFTSGNMQEKLAAALDPNASPMIKAAGAELFKPQKLGEGETIQQLDFGTGQYAPMAQGGQKIAPEVRQAMQTLGINKPLDQLSPQELGAIRNEIFQVKRASAPSVSVSMGKSIAGEVGPMMKEAQAVAQAAVKTEDSANRIIQAVDSNKLYSGTGANVRLGAAQIADTLGVGGKDLQTKIGNTRQAMQGLAQLTLEGRKQMRGEGQITNQESQLAERAISGDISFTPTEIKQLANAAKRASDYTYRNYEAKLSEMARNPDTAGLVPYYQVPRMTQPVSGGADGWSVKSVK